MHLTVTFETLGGKGRLPVQYNHLLQAAIYQALSKDVGGFFHDVGFEYGKRKFKMFTFSRLMGRAKYLKEQGCLEFEGETSLVVSSPIKQFCSSLATGFLRLGEVRIGELQLRLRSVQVSEIVPPDERMKVKVLSPIVTYSTMLKYDGSKYTCYFSPGEPEFARLIEENLRKKLEILSGTRGPYTAVEITHLGTPRLAIVNYKGTIIKGYSCPLELCAPKELLQVALDTGLGSKNSQGFGCIVPWLPVPSETVYV